MNIPIALVVLVRGPACRRSWVLAQHLEEGFVVIPVAEKFEGVCGCWSFFFLFVLRVRLPEFVLVGCTVCIHRLKRQRVTKWNTLGKSYVGRGVAGRGVPKRGLAYSGASKNSDSGHRLLPEDIRTGTVVLRLWKSDYSR